MRTLRSAGLIVSLAMLCGPTTSLAQVAGTISGYVQDQGGGAMPGATVTVESAGHLVRTTVTNPTGFFDLQALPRGVYQIKVEMTGFDTQVQKNIEVTAGANVRVDFSMRVGGLSENLVVTARTSLVETRNATQSNLIDDQRVQDLPMNGRNVVALAGTYAGVTSIRAQQDTSDGRQGPVMSVNGGNTNHNLFTLNGSVFTHFNQTTGFNPPPPDAVQEIRIQTHNFTAEYGSYGRQSGQYRVQGRYQQLPRNGMGVPSQRGAERADLLPDAKAGAEAKPDGGHGRWPDRAEQAVLVRSVPSGSGIAARPDRRRPSCRARRNGSAISPLSARSCGIR